MALIISVGMASCATPSVKLEQAPSLTKDANNLASVDDTSIRLGAVLSLTGEASAFGASGLEGIRMAIDEWNGSGGVNGHTIILAIADDKGDASEAAKAFEKLISKDKVAGIIGALMSKLSLVGAPLAQEAGVPMITPTATNEKVTQVGDYIFRACFIDPYQGIAGASFAFKDLKARNAAVFFQGSSQYSGGMAASFKTTFEKLGGRVVAYETHGPAMTNFKSPLTKILKSNPDVIYASDYYADVGLIAKQVRELGFKGPIVGGDGWDSTELGKIAGNAINNGFFTNHFAVDDASPQVQDFIGKYQKKFGRKPDALATLSYDSANIMLDAIQRAGTTEGKAIRNALANTDLACVSGHVSFDGERNPIKPAVIIEMVNGRQVYKTRVLP